MSPSILFVFFNYLRCRTIIILYICFTMHIITFVSSNYMTSEKVRQTLHSPFDKRMLLIKKCVIHYNPILWVSVKIYFCGKSLEQIIYMQFLQLLHPSYKILIRNLGLGEHVVSNKKEILN